MASPLHTVTRIRQKYRPSNKIFKNSNFKIIYLICIVKFTKKVDIKYVIFKFFYIYFKKSSNFFPFSFFSYDILFFF